MKRILTGLIAAMLMPAAGGACRAQAAALPVPTGVSASLSAPASGGQSRAFALGLALQMPTAQGEVFLASVQALREADANQDQVIAVKKLAEQAAALRRSEARAYDAASRLMQALGAPVSLRGWASGTAHLLTEPQIVSKDAQGYVKSDPATATILSTIDEAEAVKVIADQNAASLQTWLKLSQGSSGAWAATLGRLAAGLHTSAESGQPFLLPRTAVRRLRATAPPGTPTDVLHALSALAPGGKGNLGYLLHQSETTVPAANTAAPALALLDGYGAQPLAAELSAAPA